MQHRAKRSAAGVTTFYIMNILCRSDNICIIWFFLCFFYVISWSNVKAQRLFRYKKNMKISQKVIKKTTKVNTLRFIDYFTYQLCVWYFMIIFPFFYFVTDKYFSSQGAKEHLMNYNTTICWQCELAPFFSLIIRVTLELLHLLFVYSFSLFQYISCVRVQCSFVKYIFLIWMIAHTKIMKLSHFRQSHEN